MKYLLDLCFYTTTSADAGTFFYHSYILQHTYTNQEKRTPASFSIYKDGAPAIEEVLIIVPSLCQEDEQNKTYKGHDKNADGDDFCHLLYLLLVVTNI